MADIKLSFRATSGFVTDAADVTYVIEDPNTITYPTVRDTHTFGYTETIAGNLSRDRDSGIEPKVAGSHILTNGSAGPVPFRVDLPEGPGTYLIRTALGDANGASEGANTRIKVLDSDGTTILQNLNFTVALDRWVDLNDATEHIESAWEANAVAVEFAITGSIVFFEFGSGAGTGSTPVSHIEIIFVPAAAGGVGNFLRSTIQSIVCPIVRSLSNFCEE